MGKGGMALRAALRRYIVAAPKIGKYQIGAGAALGAASGAYYGLNEKNGSPTTKKGRIGRAIGHGASGAVGGAFITHGLRAATGLPGSFRMLNKVEKRYGPRVGAHSLKAMDLGANLTAPIGGAAATTLLGYGVAKNRKQYLGSQNRTKKPAGR